MLGALVTLAFGALWFGTDWQDRLGRAAVTAQRKREELMRREIAKRATGRRCGAYTN